MKTKILLIATLALIFTPGLVLAGSSGCGANGCTDNITFPDPGKFIIFQGDLSNGGGLGRVNSSFYTTYGPAIGADVRSNINPAYPLWSSTIDWTTAIYDLWGDTYWTADSPAHSPYYTFLTAARTCRDITLAQTGGATDMSVYPASEVAYTYDNAHDNFTTFLFDGVHWDNLPSEYHYDFLNGSSQSGQHNAIHGIESLICKSAQKPIQGLSLDTSSITAGATTTLRFSDNDYLGNAAQTCTLTSDKPSDPGNAAVKLPAAMGVPNCDGGGMMNLTKTGDPDQTSPLINVSAYLYRCVDASFTGISPTAPNNCTEVDVKQTCAQYSGINTAAAVGLAALGGQKTCIRWVTTSATYSCTIPAPSGAISVSPSQTTTYTYACTNLNGTTTKTATLTVGAGSYPILSVGSINASNVAIVGTPERFAGRVYQAIRSVIASVIARVARAASGPVSGKPLQLSTPITNSGASTAVKFVNAYFIDVNNDNAAAQPGVGTTTGAWDLYYTVDQTGLPNSASVNSAVTVRNNTFSPPGGTGLPDGTHGVVFCADWYGNVSNPTQPLTSRCTTKTIQYVGPGADLTASAVTSSAPNPVANQTVTLSSTITNIGSAATSGGFPDLFEINPNSIPADFASIQTVRAYSSAALPVLGSHTATATYTFPSAGVWYIRACANTDTGGHTPPTTGGVGESDYTNNCGTGSVTSTWTPVTVGSGAPPAPTVTLSPTTQSILSGQKASFTWSSTNATSCKDVATPPAFDNGPTSGTNVQTNSALTTSGIYQLSCTGPGGTKLSNQASVTVLQPGAYITASPQRVVPGQPSQISWSANDVTGCKVTGTDGFIWPQVATTTIATTSATRTINAQTVYTINCTTTGADSSASIVVNVLPSFKEF